MLQGTVGWAANKVLSYVVPVDAAARPRSTLHGAAPSQSSGSDTIDPRYATSASRRNGDIEQIPFQPRYWPPLNRPRNNAEAQQLYNHIRTVAWYLDSIPFLGSRLPFNIGVESIIGIIPGVGDYVGLILGLYQIVLCSLFGLPLMILLWMVFNVVIDCLIGVVPIIGDTLDVLFKANLRNLRLLEDHLHQSLGRCGAGTFYIEFAPSNTFMPPRQRSHRLRDPPPASSMRYPQPSRQPPPGRVPSARSYFLSLPASLAQSTSAATNLSAESKHESNPALPSGSLADAAPIASGSLPKSQAKKQVLADVDPYLVPEEESTLNLSGQVAVVPRQNVSLESSSSKSASHALSTSDMVKSGDTLQSPTKKPDLAITAPADAQRTSNALANTDAAKGRNIYAPDPSGMQALPLEYERPRVSWHDMTRTSPTTTAKPDAKRRRYDDEHDHNDDGELDADFEGQRLLKRSSSERDRELEDPRAVWRRRRSLYLLVYSAIFCVAYVTSLDANTGYLYLNFACSEYGALASFSTVAIVQQMVFAIAKPPIAKLSDVVGRPQAYVLSLVFYVCGYIIVASTRSLQSLIGGICLQSAGTTGIQVLQSIIIADTTTAKWRGLVIGIVNLPFLINFAVAGPMVDLVMRHGGWRFGFAIWTVMVPLAATPLLLTLLVGQRRARRAGLATRSTLTDKPWRQALRQLATELDLLGLLLFTGGWLLILLPLTLAGHGERQAELSTAMLIVGGVGLLVVFGWWETRASVPILPFQFLTNSAVVCTCVVGVLDFASFYISWTFLSSFVQILKGWDQTRTGYFATTQNVTSTITGIIVGSLMAMTRRYKALLMTGLAVRLLGVTLMVRYRTADDPTFMLILCQLLQGIGGGSIAITMQVAVQVTVRHADVAIVTALELLTTEIGAAIGSATAGWMFQTYLSTRLQENLPDMHADERKLVYGSLQKALSYPIGTMERTAIIKSWVEVMRMLSIVATVTLVPAVLFGLAIPDTALPDVHGGSGHHHSHGSRKGDRRASRRRPSFLSTSRPSSPIEIRGGHSDIVLGMGLGVPNADATTGSKRSRSVSRNRASERETRPETSTRHKKRRARQVGGY